MSFDRLLDLVKRRYGTYRIRINKWKGDGDRNTGAVLTAPRSGIVANIGKSSWVHLLAPYTIESKT